MKRVLYLASTLALLVSMVLVGNAFAARSHSVAAKKKIKVQLCTSTPIGVGALEPDSKGIQNGTQLAVNWMKPKLKKAGVKVLSTLNMDDGNPATGTYDTNKEAANADQCIGQAHALGYVGTLNSGAAAVSEPKLNKAHMVQISPANTNPYLTSPKAINGSGGRLTQEPCSYPHKDSCPKKLHIKFVTYHRTVTTDFLQGYTAMGIGVKKLKPSPLIKKARNYWLVDDKLSYGVGLASYASAAAKKLHVKRLGYSHIDTSGGSATETTSSAQIAATITSHKPKPDFVYCGCDEETSGALARDLRAAGYKRPWFGGDAFVTSTWFSTKNGAGSVGAKNSWATSVGLPLPKVGKLFTKLYKKYFPAFYKSPGPQAYDATSFDAAAIELKAILKAAKHHKLKGSILHQRTAVAKIVAHIKFKGVTGKTSFDKNGDTKNKVVVFYKADVKKSSWVPLKIFHLHSSPIP